MNLNKRITKLLALGAAALLSCAVFTASAANDGVELTYKSGTQTGKTAVLIRGSQIDVVATKSDTHVIDTDNPLIITKRDSTGHDVTKNFGITNKSSGSIFEKTTTFVLSPLSKVPVGVYDIAAKYSSFQYDPKISEVAGQNFPTMEMTEKTNSTQIVVAEESIMYIRYVDPHDPSAGHDTATTPYFEILRGGSLPAQAFNPTGIFRTWSISGYQQVEPANLGAPIGPNQQKFKISFDTGGYNDGTGISGGNIGQRTFYLKPNQATRKWNDADKQWHFDYSLQSGTIYKVMFEHSSSSQLILTVQDPYSTLKDLVNQAVNQSANANNYVKLTNALDTYSYITSDVNLKTLETTCGEDVFLNWEWIPDAGQESKGDVNAVLNINGYTNGSNKQWVTAGVVPLQEDVTGKLRVTASYTNVTLNEDMKDESGKKVTSVSADLSIIIHGRGVSASATRYSQRVGNVTADTIFTDTKFPTKPVSMDVYTGSISYVPQPSEPFSYTIRIKVGSGNGELKKLDVLPSAPGVLDTYVIAGSKETLLTNGSFTMPKGYSADHIDVRFIAKKAAKISVELKYFVTGATAGSLREDPYAMEKNLSFIIMDSSPDDTATLESLVAKTTDRYGSNQSPLENFTFDPAKFDYGDVANPIVVPYRINSVTFTPKNYSTAQPIMAVSVQTTDDKGLWVENNTICNISKKQWIIDYGKNHTDASNLLPSVNSGAGILSDNRSFKLELKDSIDQLIKVQISVRAQNPNVVNNYTLYLRRENPSTDGTLQTLQMLDFNDQTVDYLKGQFAPNKNAEYFITVPYSTKKLVPVTATTHDQSQVTITSNAPSTTLFAKLMSYVTKTHPPVNLKGYDEGETVITIAVKPEKDVVFNTENDVMIYVVHVTKAPPGTDATLKSLKLTDSDDKDIKYTPDFKADTIHYEVDIPYSIDKVRFTAETTDKYATMTLKRADGTGDEVVLKQNVGSGKIEIPYLTEANPSCGYILTVTAEDEITKKEYELYFFREPPESNAYLNSFLLFDSDGNKYDFGLIKDVYEYTYELPFEAEKISVNVKPESELVHSMYMGFRKLTSGKNSPLVNIAADGTTKIEVVVTAQDKLTKNTYTVNLTRAIPNTDSRLKKLAVSGAEPLKPQFIASTTEYTTKMNDGSNSLTVTATANDPYATIKINGTPVKSGVASEPIELITVHNTINIVVTAQDRKTSTTYQISVVNQNLIEKSNNADLKSLVVLDGNMLPKFEAGVTEYEVAVGEETYAVEIRPTPADEYAQVKVFNGTKEIGDANGKYTSAVQEGENEFRVEVTAPDKSKTKVYKIMVYKNEEGKMGLLTPITADDLDFDQNPIIVDITKYSVIAADVFNTLKELPETRIIFMGNDYSLEMKGADIKTTIPQTQTFNFGMSFTSPNENDIMSLMANMNVTNLSYNPVIIHFNYHGSLPAPTIFTLSLGQKYKNQTIHWHYYNEERARIDYYGRTKANTKGTFSLTLTHMSDYIETNSRIIGSEDKSAGGLITGGKLNPNTAEDNE